MVIGSAFAFLMVIFMGVAYFQFRLREACEARLDETCRKWEEEIATMRQIVTEEIETMLLRSGSVVGRLDRKPHIGGGYEWEKVGTICLDVNAWCNKCSQKWEMEDLDPLLACSCPSFLTCEECGQNILVVHKEG